MKTEYRKANIGDAQLLVDIYNSSFYCDYLKYGVCPGYGKTKGMMEKSIVDYPKFLILCDGNPVGVLSCQRKEPGVYEIGCLCVIPEYQRKGIGTEAFQFAMSYYDDWQKFTLVTPADKEDNVKFYTEKCGFHIESYEMDGTVRVARFLKNR